MLHQFVTTVYRAIPGASVRFSTFVSDFHAYLTANGGNPAEWSPDRIDNELEALGCPVGFAGNKIVGNLAAPFDRLPRWTRVPGPKRQLRKFKVTV